MADSRGPFGSFGTGAPSLNNAGDVALLANFDDPETPAGVFVSESGTLDGSTVRDLTFCGEGLSDTDRLTFVATLDDPDAPGGTRTAVFRATPRS